MSGNQTVGDFVPLHHTSDALSVTAAKNGDFRRSNDEGIEKHTQTQ